MIKCRKAKVTPIYLCNKICTKIVGPAFGQKLPQLLWTQRVAGKRGFPSGKYSCTARVRCDCQERIRLKSPADRHLSLPFTYAACPGAARDSLGQRAQTQLCETPRGHSWCCVGCIPKQKSFLVNSRQGDFSGENPHHAFLCTPPSLPPADGLDAVAAPAASLFESHLPLLSRNCGNRGCKELSVAISATYVQKAL